MRPAERHRGDAAPVGPVALSTKKSSVIEWLRNEILSGALPPERQLRQEEIAERLGISATPVREAFAVLEAEGLLESRPHRGVVVAPRDPEELRDTYEIRTWLETHAARRAAARVSPKDITALERALAEAGKALRRVDSHAFREANARFHEVILRASGSKTYTGFGRILIARTLFAVPLDATRRLDVLRDHKELIQALRRGDAARAAMLVRRHLEASAEAVRAGAGWSGRP